MGNVAIQLVWELVLVLVQEGLVLVQAGLVLVQGGLVQVLVQRGLVAKENLGGQDHNSDAVHESEFKQCEL
jgi:hypothetical protein